MTLQNNVKISIPKGWCLVKHKDIATINPKFKTPPVGEDEFVSFIPMSLVEAETGKVYLSEQKQYKDVKKGYTPFVDGDLIFAKITPCMENGKIAILNNLYNQIGFGSTEFHVSRINKLIKKKYIYFYFAQKIFKVNAKKHMTGSAGQLRVPKLYFENVLIPLPPLPEQHRIVEKIEELFSELDQGIESLKTAQQQLKIYRQAVLKWAFEGKLTAEWREQQQKAGTLESAETLLENIKLEREKRYQQQLEEWKEKVKVWEDNGKEGKKPSKPKQQKATNDFLVSNSFELEKIPNEWLCIKAECLSEFITKGTTPSKDKLFKDNGDIPFIKVYNLTHTGVLDISINPTFVSRETHNGFLARSKVFPGDVLMNIVGPPLGKVSLVPNIYEEWNINQAIVRYRTYNFLLNEYLKNYLLSQETLNRMSKKAKATAGQFNLTLEICRNIEVPVCCFAEQHQIVQEIETRFSVCDQLEATIKDNLEKAEALRQSILKRAFEGKLVPQNPNDEPAEKLLERIRQEKARSKL